ncbi:MAG: ATP synthase F0 subunit B [Deltaproteobacteria bacterium]|jgi:F-type H+-transporting ATPase subunit b|nr:ATP synthase F0 subunit B [Deltaproteobacteria bacterium]MBW1958364.1 ATP synthase F0 subunit B [Deltaproteobacteria bacterium]MBW2013620.1 ATP synthase F0 subunit B [Deltaproteobacteria bacterium]MBW2089324.1 ATP synthase F0 subunit B [Deltaproteobacteria bacterium]MBW2320046.1 ATP synthase F0 subunit B [Deltaproteobacteria bacterium]
MKIVGLNRNVWIIFYFILASLWFAGVAFGAGGITVIPDWTLFVQIANFLVIIWVLNIILFRPIRNILIQRKEKITSLEQNIETSDKEATEKNEAFDSGIRDARAKGLNEKNALLQEAADQEREIIDKINQKAQADLAEVREKIAKDAEAVRASLQKEIDTFASAIGQKILGRAL